MEEGGKEGIFEVPEDDGGSRGVDGLVRQLVSMYNLKSHFFDPHTPSTEHHPSSPSHIYFVIRSMSSSILIIHCPSSLRNPPLRFNVVGPRLQSGLLEALRKANFSLTCCFRRCTLPSTTLWRGRVRRRANRRLVPSAANTISRDPINDLASARRAAPRREWPLNTGNDKR